VTGRSFVFMKGLVLAATLVATAACSPAAVAEGPQADYDPETGRLRRLTLDLDQDGRHDAVSIMDGARIDHVEIDADENGKADRWDFYRDHTLDRVGFSRLNDGVMDSQVVYGTDDKVTRIDISTGRDGRFNRVEWYEAGVLTRSEEDTDGDGHPDKWETYRPNVGAGPNEPPYTIASVAFDDSGTGVPRRRVVYEPDGRSHVETYPVADSASSLPGHK
jgi:hypothetical protein